MAFKGRYYAKGADIYTIFELTANRGDLLSMLGMAYEIGAIYGKKVKDIDLSHNESGEDINKSFNVKVNTENCSLFLARKVNNVTIKESPKVVSKPSCELQVSSGTKGTNNWYTTNVVISFKTKTSTNGATITSYGIGTSETYNKLDKYTISKDGNHVIKGYVKDSNGYTATCSITIKRDATKPSCSLSVTSGTVANDGTYTSNITIGFKSKSDATSGMNSFGLGTSTTYKNNHLIHL